MTLVPFGGWLFMALHLLQVHMFSELEECHHHMVCGKALHLG